MHNSEMTLPTLAYLRQSAAAGELPTLIAELQGHDGLRGRWIAHALRVDLATVTAHPALIFPCLWNRFRCEAPPGASFRRPPIMAPEVSAAIGEALDEWRLEHRGSPWARSLRPPVFPIEGALREEYRALYPRGRRLHVTEGILTVLGKNPVAWDRLRGVRVSPPAVPPAAEDEWLIDANTEHFCLSDRKSEAVRLECRLRPGDTLTSFAATPDRVRIAAGGRTADRGGVICLFHAGKLLWSHSLTKAVQSVGISADGRVVAAFLPDGSVTILMGARGGGETMTAFVGAEAGTLSAKGDQLITCTRRVLRVWNVADLGLGLEGLPELDRSLTGASFSPDGLTLLTGNALCDADTGAVRAFVNVDRDERRVLSNTRVLESSMMKGLRIWHAQTGKLLQSRERWIDGLWEPRFDPHGRHFTGIDMILRTYLMKVDDPRSPVLLGGRDAKVWQFGPEGDLLATGHPQGVVRLWAVPAGTLISECHLGEAAEINAIAFSADSTRIVAGTDLGELGQWETHSGRLLAKRLPDPNDPDVKYQNGPWRWDFEHGEPEVHGWEGFRSHTHPYVVHWEDGVLLIEHEADAHAPIAALVEEHLVINSDGTRAAWKDAHFALETE